MTFSIIIPVYNVAPYLRECLDSVLAAARTLEVGSRNYELGVEVGSKNYELGMKDRNSAIPPSAIPNSSFSLRHSVEIICVDDGSTDGSGEVLDEWGREKVGRESRSTAEGGPVCEGEGRRSRSTAEGSNFGRLEDRSSLSSHWRAAAERKVEEWLEGVDEATFEAALVKLVEEKSAAEEYRFKRDEERELALEGARRFYREFSRKLVPLSDGRFVYFAPDPRARTRNASNAISWAEYAFHAVSSSGKLLDGKNFRERLYNATKAADLSCLEGIIRSEHCMYRLIDAHPENDAVVFVGQDDASGRLEVITRLDVFGNVEANLGEVTVIAKHKRKENPPPKFRPLTEVVETVAKHQAAGFSPSTTDRSIAQPAEARKGDGEEKVKVKGEGEQWMVDSVDSALRAQQEPNIHSPTPTIDSNLITLRVIHQPNAGVSAARNAGLKAAGGLDVVKYAA